MISPNRRRLGGLVLAVALVPNAASAQTVARSFDELQRTLKVGQTVFVTDESGRQTQGKVADVSASSLVILTPETRTFVEGAVTEIRRTDRLWKGALIGLGAGAIPGATAGLAGCAQYSCPRLRWSSWLAKPGQTGARPSSRRRACRNAISGRS